MLKKCINCGKKAVSERICQMTHTQDTRSVLIENNRHMHCESCGNISYLGDQISEIEQAIACKIREEENLLSPEELKAVRLKYDLTQNQMDNVIDASPKTWIRLERGKVAQSKDTDTLIRQISESRELLCNLLSQPVKHRSI